MKIIHICQFLGVGGLEKVLLTLCQEQLINGHEVELAVYDIDRRWVPKFQEAGIKVHQDYQKAPGYDLNLLKYLEKLISHADIVHTHDLNPALYLAPIRLKQLLTPGQRPIKYLHTTHGMEHLDLQPMTRIYEAFIGMVTPKIVTVSPKFQRYYQSQFLTKTSKVHLINNGTQIMPLGNSSNRKLEICAEFKLDPNKDLGVYVARVVPLKMQKELIEYYKKGEHQLLLVGPSGNDSYFNECKKALSKNIVMTGSRDDISWILSGCDYFISASAHEGLPIAVLEAAAAGLPCLLSDIPGHRTFNQRTKCVELFSNTEDPTIKIRNVIAGAQYYTTAFSEEIKNEYSAQAMAAKYHELYEELKC